MICSRKLMGMLTCVVLHYLGTTTTLLSKDGNAQIFYSAQHFFFNNTTNRLLTQILET